MSSILVEVANAGGDITATNYWDTPFAKAGGMYLTVNAGCFRLLLPEGSESVIREIDAVGEVVISRGPSDLGDAIELLFDDDSGSPFAIHLSAAQTDRPFSAEHEAKRWVFTAWVHRRGKPHKSVTKPCWVRLVDRIPCLAPRTGPLPVPSKN